MSNDKLQIQVSDERKLGNGKTQLISLSVSEPQEPPLRQGLLLRVLSISDTSARQSYNNQPQ